MSRDVTMAAPQQAEEVEMVEPEVVRQLRELSALGWGATRIAAELGLARNTVRRYVRGAEVGARRPRSSAWMVTLARRHGSCSTTTAEGNAVVVEQDLASRRVVASVRTVQRAAKDEREAQRAAEETTVRFETAPGHQMQIDFGQKRVRIGAAQSLNPGAAT